MDRFDKSPFEVRLPEGKEQEQQVESLMTNAAAQMGRAEMLFREANPGVAARILELQIPTETIHSDALPGGLPELIVEQRTTWYGHNGQEQYSPLNVHVADGEGSSHSIACENMNGQHVLCLDGRALAEAAKAFQNAVENGVEADATFTRTEVVLPDGITLKQLSLIQDKMADIRDKQDDEDMEKVEEKVRAGLSPEEQAVLDRYYKANGPLAMKVKLAADREQK